MDRMKKRKRKKGKSRTEQKIGRSQMDRMKKRKRKKGKSSLIGAGRPG